MFRDIHNQAVGVAITGCALGATQHIELFTKSIEHKWGKPGINN